MDRLKLLPVCFLLAGLVTPLGGEALPEGYDTIYLDRGASPEVREAAEDLAGLLDRSYGTWPVIRPEPLWSLRKGIRIGPGADNPAFDSDPLTDEVLVARTQRGLEIRGPDNTATRFAVYRFCEAFLGWRYYQPGELGLERLDPSPDPPTVGGEPGILLYEKAAYLSRNPSMGNFRDGPDWEIWHGIRERFQYNHSLHRVVPPLVFDTHPGWFAKDEEGEPMRPPYYPRVHGYNDHPDLTHPELREHVVDRSLARLEAATPFRSLSETRPPDAAPLPRLRTSPGVVSISLSLGDSFVFGHFPEDYPWRPDGTFRRWPDWSNHVFAYTNSVAESISSEWKRGQWEAPGERPGLYLGALAYLNWENVPDFPVHPSLVPYLTYDRSQWYDPEARADDLGNVAAWNRTGPPFLGTWDYLFGYGFLIPRSMTGIVADSIPALHKRGVRAYFSQVVPIWPYDGHTNWLTARLLWNPDADAGRLLEEYFSGFYGPAAGPMRRFFDTAEQLWMDQAGRGWWLRYWKDPWQAALWSPEDLRAMEDLLNEARRLARQQAPGNLEPGLSTARFSMRVGETADLFNLTRAFLNWQWAAWELQAAMSPPASGMDAETVRRLAWTALKARKELVSTHTKLRKDVPRAGNVRDLAWVFRYDQLGAAIAACARSMDPANPLLAELQSALGEWCRIKGSDTAPALERPSRQVLYDTTLSEVANPRIWHRQFMDSEGMSQRPAPGGTGFLAENVRRGHLYQLFACGPGAWYLGLVDVRTRQSPTGEVYIRIGFFDAANELIAQSSQARIVPVARYGDVQRLAVLMRAPENSVHGRLFIRFYEMDPGSRARIDQARVYEFAPASP